jgi:hypothetical protein
MTRTVIESKTKTVIIGFDEPFCVIGERINPTGRKKLAAELEAGNYDTVIKDALEQVACGATVLDVNSGAVFTNMMATDPRYADNNFVEPPLMKALIEIVQQSTGWNSSCRWSRSTTCRSWRFPTTTPGSARIPTCASPWPGRSWNVLRISAFPRMTSWLTPWSCRSVRWRPPGIRSSPWSGACVTSLA